MALTPSASGAGAWALAAILAAALASPADACPEPSLEILFHSCWGAGARAEIRLLPEDGLPEPGPALQLAVTGAYTGTDTREGGAPNPVGLLIREGRTVNPTLARMDGILVIGGDGRPRLHHRERVPVAKEPADLTDLEERRRFIAWAEAAGASVLQSHLLVVEGRSDVREREQAPRFRRRLFFEDGAGFGLFQTADPLTLAEAADAVLGLGGVRMALNLDMGSYDYCRRARGAETDRCGYRSGTETAGLSNLLVLALD